MDVLDTQVNSNDAQFRDNASQMAALVTELRDQLALAREGGGEQYLQRHREQGKLPVRDRIGRLLDPGSPLLELSPLAAWDLYDNEAPGAGLVTGIGRVSGREVLIVANDATVKGGTYYPITVKKHLRAQQIAIENHLPCVYLVDSGGAFLPLAGGGLSGSRSLRPHLLQPGTDVGSRHSADRGRHGIVHGRAVPMSLRCPTKRSS